MASEDEEVTQIGPDGKRRPVSELVPDESAPTRTSVVGPDTQINAAGERVHRDEIDPTALAPVGRSAEARAAEAATESTDLTETPVDDAPVEPVVDEPVADAQV